MEQRSTDWGRWVEIDLEALAHNVAEVKQLLGPDVRMMAVVKSDGYGHGLVPAARVALAKGAAMLGVTHPEEGILLREDGIAAPVLIFRPLLPGEEEVVVNYQLTLSLSTLEQAELLDQAARRAGRIIAVHIKVETGMLRTGFTPKELEQATERLLELNNLRYEGIYTHFAVATNCSFTKEQYRLFQGAVDGLAGRGLEIPLRHVCNSTAAILYPELRMEMVRVGTLIYGQLPAGVGQSTLDLHDTWSLWCRVIHLRQARRGESVGYGRTARLKQDTTLAVIPVGYSDGLGIDVTPHPAGLVDLLKVLVKTVGAYCGLPWGTGFVRVEDHLVPLVGRIGMELSCIDVGKLAGVKIGTPVMLTARRTVIRAGIPRLYRGGVSSEGAGSSGVEDKHPPDLVSRATIQEIDKVGNPD